MDSRCVAQNPQFPGRLKTLAGTSRRVGGLKRLDGGHVYIMGAKTMSSLTFRSSRPDRWTDPKGFNDASLRRMTHGKIQPMYQPTFLERLFGAR